MSENGNNKETFITKARLIYLMLIAGIISVTFLTAIGKSDTNTYMQIMSILLAYVAGWVSPRRVE